MLSTVEEDTLKITFRAYELERANEDSCVVVVRIRPEVATYLARFIATLAGNVENWIEIFSMPVKNGTYHVNRNGSKLM